MSGQCIYHKVDRGCALFISNLNPHDVLAGRMTHTLDMIFESSISVCHDFTARSNITSRTLHYKLSRRRLPYSNTSPEREDMISTVTIECKVIPAHPALIDVTAIGNAITVLVTAAPPVGELSPTPVLPTMAVLLAPPVLLRPSVIKRGATDFVQRSTTSDENADLSLAGGVFLTALSCNNFPRYHPRIGLCRCHCR